MQPIKNIKLGKIRILFLILIFNLFIFFLPEWSFSQDTNIIENKYLKIKILDKVSSKNSNITLEIGKEIKFKNNIKIKILIFPTFIFFDNFIIFFVWVI